MFSLEFYQIFKVEITSIPYEAFQNTEEDHNHTHFHNSGIPRVGNDNAITKIRNPFHHDSETQVLSIITAN